MSMLDAVILPYTPTPTFSCRAIRHALAFILRTPTEPILELNV